jgi:outer membrane protein
MWRMRQGLRGLSLVALAAGLAAGLAAPAAAETLLEALARAYVSNPTLTAARANQMATDEDVAIQRAAGRPTAQINSTYSENVLLPDGQFVVIPRTLNSQAQINVPIYQGGAIRNRIKSASARVAAAEENLRGTESSVFSQVVAAYNDVLRDSAIVEFNTANVKNLEVNLQSTRDRFEVGDLTRTDVAQSEARLSQARADLRNAEANLIAARERFLQQVGAAPDGLQPPPPLPGLPGTVDEALDVALKENPDIAAARKVAEAAGLDVKVARAGRLPTINGFGTFSRNDNFGGAIASVPINIPSTQESASVGAQLTIPIYQGGLPSAQIRQARARQLAAMEDYVAAERNVVQQVRSAYASWKASLDVIRSAEAAIAANRLSLEGVQVESSVGNRTIIEVLNAEQELINSRVQLATAQRNAYVAAFTLLAAMGSAEARDLGLEGIDYFDNAAYTRRLKGELFDWTGTPKPMVRSTRTVDVPAQDAVIR